jgi:hypothetical protein
MPGFKSGPWLQSTGLAACHTWPAERLAGPWLGGPVQLRSGLRASAGYTRAGCTHGVVTARSGALIGGSLATWCTPGAPVGPRGGVGQGVWGRRSPERRCGVEAVEKPQDSGVRRQGESSGGRWRWRRSPAVSVRKREGEGVLNWGQWWRMGGSHRDVVEAMALGWEPERRRGLRRQEPTRRTRRRWRRGGGLSSGTVERRTTTGARQRSALF